MATNVYSGLNGSGKSYEAVLSVIVPNIRDGRRVVTNVKGLEPEKIVDYIIKHNPESDSSKFGEVIMVDDSDIFKPNFFPLDDTPLDFAVPDWVPSLAFRRYVNYKGSLGPDALQLLFGELKKLEALSIDLESALNEAVISGWKTFRAKYFLERPKATVFCETPDYSLSIVKPGDLVLIDEAWNFYEKSKPLNFDHMTFFRMHRHFVHPDNGFTCDIVLLTQNITDLHPRILAVVETHFRMEKLKMVGMNERYRVDMYQGAKTVRASLLKSFQRKYDKEVFPLYKSYDSSGAQEKVIDSRLNLFTPKLFIGAALCLGLIAFGAVSVYRFFSPSKPALSQQASKPSVSKLGSASPGSPSPTKLEEPSPARIAGSVTLPSGVRYVVVSDLGVMQWLSPSQFSSDSGRMAVGNYQGRRVYFAVTDRGSSSFFSGSEKK